MLTFAKKTDGGTTVTYEYLPNGANRAGLASINRITGKASVIEKPPMTTTCARARCSRMSGA